MVRQPGKGPYLAGGGSGAGDGSGAGVGSGAAGEFWRGHSKELRGTRTERLGSARMNIWEKDPYQLLLLRADIRDIEEPPDFMLPNKYFT